METVDDLMTAAIKAYEAGKPRQALSTVAKVTSISSLVTPGTMTDTQLLEAACYFYLGVGTATSVLDSTRWRFDRSIYGPHTLRIAEALSKSTDSPDNRRRVMDAAGKFIDPTALSDRAWYWSFYGDVDDEITPYQALEHYGTADMLFQRAGDFEGELRNKLKLIRTALEIGESAFVANLFLEAEALVMRVDDEALRDQLSEIFVLHAG